jgi:predicted nucleotidyltransferase
VGEGDSSPISGVTMVSAHRATAVPRASRDAKVVPSVPGLPPGGDERALPEPLLESSSLRIQTIGNDEDVMMAARTLRRLVEVRRTEVRRIARAHGAQSIRLTGSVARGDERAGSDVDFLMRFGPGSSLFDQAGLVHDLEQLLGVEVDVVSEGGLRESDVAMREDATVL